MIRNSRQPFFAALMVSIAMTGCADSRVKEAPKPAIVRTELFFGISPADRDDGGAGEARWREFLDHEITPRFPDGLSVYDVYGQWRADADKKIAREHSKEVMILFFDSPQHRSDIEAIRAAWKRLTGDQSVLRVMQPADAAY